MLEINMKTTIRQGVEEQQFYSISDLENQNEIWDLIMEAESTLEPCSHCGNPHPLVMYRYCPSYKENEHCFYIECRSHERDGLWFGSCGRRTNFELGAKDTVYDIKEVLNAMCSMWNQRYDNTKGTPIEEMKRFMEEQGSPSFP
jgi:hypothetical protein